jgi:hypothetical protein
MKAVASIFRIVGLLLALNGAVGANIVGIAAGALLIFLSYAFPTDNSKNT